MDEPFDKRVQPLRRAWRHAADDLAIRVVTDGASIIEDDGKHHPLVALIPDFGGGMHIFETFDQQLADLAWKRGHGHTVLGGGYERYERALFIEALDDWSWTGPGEPPSWYSEPGSDD